MAMPEFLSKTTGSLPNWAWIGVIVVGAGAGYLFVRNSNKTSTNASTAVATPAITDTTGQPGVNNAPVDQSGSGVLTVPGGPGGSVPILPPGYTPIYDSQGNLIGWEPPGTAPPTQQPPASPPIWQGNPIWSNVPGSTATGNPLIPQGKLPSGNYVLGSQLVWGGQTYTTVPGAGGRLWGVPGTMSGKAADMTAAKILLYAPASYYH